MRAEIRHLLCPDIEPDTFVPEDPSRFSFLVQLLAGPAGEEGEESFDFVVCTPGWLADRVEQDGPTNGRHHVIVNRFDWPALRDYFERLVAGISGADWADVGAKLSRYGRWEFEDYLPAPD
jgi:hypothetical protein